MNQPAAAEQQISAWEKSLELLRTDLPQTEYMTWIAPLKAQYAGDKIYLYAPNAIAQKWVQDKYRQKIVKALKAQHNEGKYLEPIFSVNTYGSVSQAAVSNAQNGRSQVAQLKHTRRNHQNQLIADFTLDRFVRGESNELACVGAQSVIDRCSESRHSPFFIFGGVGLGKTHLMHSIGHMIKNSYPEKSMICCTSEDFCNDFIHYVRINQMQTFKDYYRCEVLLIDDVQFFLGKAKSEDELFYTIDSIGSCGGQVVLTCDRFPNDLCDIGERLRSRFNGGLTVEIKGPDLGMRIEILQKKAQEADYSMDEDVASYIAQHITRNVRELEGVLSRMILTATSQRVGLNLDIARIAVKDVRPSPRNLTAKHIQEQVCEYYSVNKKELLSTSRSRSCVLPRHVAMSLTRELTALSYPEIGKAFGRRDHTTAIHACKKINKLRKADRQLASAYENLHKKLSA